MTSSSISDGSPRERLLQAATTLFCQKGFNAVGVDAIVAEAGTAKTSLYKVFGSKDGLVEAVLEAEGKAWREWFIARVTRSGRTPAERLNGLFKVLGAWFAERTFYGCPFINAVGEHDKTNDRLRAIALAHKRQVLDFIKALCIEAGSQDAERLTHEIALLIDGAIVAALITKNPKTADVAQGALQALLAREGIR